jgi:hypothetical protein
LVELDNYILLPEVVWNKLVAIYHGGPPIERIYPKIYRSLIVKAFLNEDCKFSFKIKKFSKTSTFNIEDIATETEKQWRPYYKYPGKNNWMLLPTNRAARDEIFNSIRTYLVFVRPDLEEEFKDKFNILTTK